VRRQKPANRNGEQIVEALFNPTITAATGHHPGIAPHGPAGSCGVSSPGRKDDHSLVAAGVHSRSPVG